MEELFILDDLLNVLIELEDKGFKFYGELSERVEGIELRSLFKSLAEAEKTHKSLYQGIKKKIDINNNTDYIDEEYKKYLEVLINNNFIISKIPKQEMNLEEGIVLAETLEKETMLFLNELINIMPDEIELMKILSEEKRHLYKILKYKKEQTKQEDFVGKK